MAFRTRPAYLPATRTVRYPDVAATSRPAEVIILSPAQITAREQAQRVAYLEWKLRQTVIAQKDQKVRRVLFGVGAVIGLALLATVAVVGFVLAHVLSGLGLLAIPAALLAGSGLVYGGHRCITIVQHWH